MNNFTVIVKDKFLKAVKNYNMFSDVYEVVVGFSGGADSVCLLHILDTYKDVFGYSVKAVHINHGIRGAEADFDEKFAENFCMDLGIPFFSEKIDCIAEAKANKESIEECGRRLRYEKFNEFCVGNSVIATAHNANDNAETMIFNITRGTSVKGLCGIPFVRDNIIRPLLYCSRKEIEAYCNENGLSYVTDSTNAEVEYTRNKIRHMVLPVLEQINPNLIDLFSSLSDNAELVSDFMTSKVNELLNVARKSPFCYDRTILLNSNKAVVLQLLSSEFNEYSEMVLDSKKTNALYDLLVNCGRLQLFGNIFAEVKKDYLRFYKMNAHDSDKCFEISELPVKTNFGDYYIELENISDYSKIVNQIDGIDVIDYSSLSGNLVLRTRKAGDKFTFPKRNVTKSLKKLFTEENVPIELRDKIPVISDDDGVVWVHTFGVTKRCCTSKDSDNIILVRGKNNDR